MTQCWPEGELRAYLDRELSTGDMQQLAAHLGECAACDALCTELSERAARVSALMELLPEHGPLAARPAMAAVRKPAQQHRWVPYAVALAACLALAVYLKPKPAPQVAAVSPAPVTVHDEPPAPPAAVAALGSEMSVVPASRTVRSVRKPSPAEEVFVALDDEPFESGVIMRVDVKPGNLQADVVFGPDGRARAFRLVKANNRNLTRY
ncbi:MAG: zf-HC2 domain-containing protein [Candidatus Solibacter sp.]